MVSFSNRVPIWFYTLFDTKYVAVISQLMFRKQTEIICITELKKFP